MTDAWAALESGCMEDCLRELLGWNKLSQAEELRRAESIFGVEVQTTVVVQDKQGKNAIDLRYL